MRLVLVIVALLLPTDASAKKCIEDRTVTGLVEDAHGAPLPDALVGVSWAVDEQPKGPAIAYTDSEGKFAIPLTIASVCKGTFRYSVKAFTRTHESLVEAIEDAPVVIPVPTLRVIFEIAPTPRRGCPRLSGTTCPP